MRIDGFLKGQGVGTVSISDILSKLNPGDIVRARILEIAGSEVLLKLLDGSKLKAETMVDINARKGDYANFIVKSNSENRLLLEQVKTGALKIESIEAILLKTLEAAGIPANEKNMEIAEKLKQNFIPLSKELFADISEAMEKFKDLNAAKAVTLYAHNIEANEQNVSSLKLLTDTKMQVGKELEQIIGRLASAEDSSEVKEIASIALSERSEPEIAQFIKNELQKGSSALVSNLFNGADIELKIKYFLMNNKNGPTDIGNDAVDQFFNDMPAILKPSDKAMLTELLRDLTAKFSQVGNKTEENKNIIKKPIVSSLGDELKDIFIKLDKENTSKELYIKEVYKELYEKLEVLKSNPGLTGLSENNDLLLKAENLQNHLKFINNLNTHNTYIQIPINIFNKNNTGELYILKRESRKKKIDPGNLTMLIALDTHFLGRFEALISVSKNNIALNVRVDDQNVINLLKENYKELYNRINDKGYKLVDVKYRLIDEPVDVVNINEVVTRELSYGKVSVDIKL